MPIPDSFPPRISRTAQVAEPPAESTTATSAPTVPTAPTAPTAPAAPAPVAWRWRRTALLLSLAAQVLTVAALTSQDRIPASWAGLLLATAPVPLALLAAFLPFRQARLAVAVAIVVLVAGLIGEITHTGLFFLPALAAYAGAAARMWREP
jgi:drug/metabolite transporter (DMT)-like permease